MLVTNLQELHEIISGYLSKKRSNSSFYFLEIPNFLNIQLIFYDFIIRDGYLYLLNGKVIEPMRVFTKETPYLSIKRLDSRKMQVTTDLHLEISGLLLDCLIVN